MINNNDGTRYAQLILDNFKPDRTHLSKEIIDRMQGEVILTFTKDRKLDLLIKDNIEYLKAELRRKDSEHSLDFLRGIMECVGMFINHLDLNFNSSYENILKLYREKELTKK